MKQMVSKAKFKPRALEYFRQVEKRMDEIVITDHGHPVVKIIPYSTDPSEVLKELRGSVKKYIDPTKPIGLKDWEALQ